MTGPGSRDQFPWYVEKGTHVRWGFRLVYAGLVILIVILVVVGFAVVP